MTKSKQAELALLAKLGERPAANELAESVWSWVYRKAYIYAKKSGHDVEDLASVMWTAFPAAVRSYQPSSGTFINYFAFAASRLVTRYMARQSTKVKAVASFEEAPDREQSDPDAADAVDYLLSQLSPVDRLIVKTVADDVASVKLVARRLGRPRSVVLHRAAELFDLLRSRAVQNGPVASRFHEGQG